MGTTTEIAWTDHTFNPWIGCTRVSPGCKNCYAEARDARYGEGLWGKDAPRRVTSDQNWRQPIKWNRAAEADRERRRVFCASLADVFEDRPDLLISRGRLFGLIAETPWLDWQLLTKRPENVRRLVPLPWVGIPGAWPANVWIGTTVEDQTRADERIPHLLRIPAAVRFLSCEPLIGRVDIDGMTWRDIGWCIVGGESGPNYRALDIDHARNLRDQCNQYDVPLFFKQVGGVTPKAGGHLLDGIEHREFPT